jgi:uncharacterized protein (DUF39 family)
MQNVWFNDVEAYTGLAAVDAYIGATQLSETRGMDYGGAHVIEDLLRGKSVDVHATAYGTDCYPRKQLDTTITLDDINQAVMMNPRNGYQKYNVATNSSNRTLHTYMGALLPDFGNATYSAAGVLSPISNDPNYETIGTGTRIFLGGAQGYITGEGTQHDPGNGFGTIMVQGDLKKMNPDYVRAAILRGYGTSLYLGIGVPIPIINEKVAQATAVSDADISTAILDYAVESRARPKLGQVTYEELKSGTIDINGKEVPLDSSVKPMLQTQETPLVGDIMSDDVVTIKQDASVHEAAKKILESAFNHLPVVSNTNSIVGIVTAWDISKAVAEDRYDLVEDIMTKKTITAVPGESIDVAAYRLDLNRISAMPIVDKDNQVIGIITSDDISKLLARRC